MKRNYLIALLVTAGVVLGAVALALVFRGSDGGIPPSALSTDEWRARVNEICRDTASQVESIQSGETESEFAEFIVAVSPIWDAERAQIKELGLPDELATEAGELLTAMDYLSAALLEIHIATQRYDEDRRYEASLKRDAAADSIRRYSQALGLDACADRRIP